MKIAITGHTAGIGAAFADRLKHHEIVGISKRDGHNIRNIPKVVPMIIPCDIWINNAQSGYAQTELLYQIWEAWRGQPNKFIWIVSTILTTHAGIPNIPGMSYRAIAEYKNQKKALEDAFQQLKVSALWPRMCLIRPGTVATQNGQIPNTHGADVYQWVDSVVEFYRLAIDRNLWIEEMSLGFQKNLQNI